MHRRQMHRVFATILVAWFTALISEPVTLHPCPMHDAVPRSHSAGATQRHADAMAGMNQHTTMHVGHHGATSGSGSEAHRCTCIGACTPTSAGGLVADEYTLTGALITASPDTGLPDYAYVPVAAQHALPFAHAPPLPLRAL
jgi:hypothetical protein